MRREGRATHRFHAMIPRFQARNIHSLIYSRRTSGPTPVPCCFFADSLVRDQDLPDALSEAAPAPRPTTLAFSLQPCGSSHSKGLGRPTEAEPLEPLPVVCRQRRHQLQGLVRCGVAHPQRVGVQQQPRARRVRLRACAVLRVSGDGAAGVLCVQPDLVHPPADGARLSRDARVKRGAAHTAAGGCVSGLASHSAARSARSSTRKRVSASCARSA